jgi:hypothetical protein
MEDHDERNEDTPLLELPEADRSASGQRQHLHAGLQALRKEDQVKTLAEAAAVLVWAGAMVLLLALGSMR